MQKTIGSAKTFKIIAVLLVLFCQVSHAEVEPGEIAKSGEKDCGIQPVIVGATDAFLTIGGTATGLAASSAIAILAHKGESEPIHFSAAKRGAQVAGLMLILAAVPVYFFDDLFTLSYFFGAGIGGGEILTATAQVGHLRSEARLSEHKPYAFLAGAHFVLGLAKMVAFSYLAAEATLHGEDCHISP